MPPQPRHARARAKPAAAAANREAGTAAKATRAARVTPEGAAVTGAQLGASAARDAGRARIPTGDRQYEGVILAEFLVAVLIVGVAPLARGKPSQGQSNGPSPYGVDDIKQLAGIGAAYFILALLSSGKHGRMAAWFGGLILLAIGLSQTTSGGLGAIFGIFQPSALSAGPAGASGAAGGIQDQGIAQAAVGVGQRQAATGNQAGAVPDASGIFPVVTPGGQVIPAGVVEPTPTGAPSFTQQVTQASTGNLVQSYTGGPGVVTTNTGTQLALRRARRADRQGRSRHDRLQSRQLDGPVHPADPQHQHASFRVLQDCRDRRLRFGNLQRVRRCQPVGHRHLRGE